MQQSIYDNTAMIAFCKQKQTISMLEDSQYCAITMCVAFAEFEFTGPNRARLRDASACSWLANFLCSACVKKHALGSKQMTAATLTHQCHCRLPFLWHC